MFEFIATEGAYVRDLQLVVEVCNINFHIGRSALIYSLWTGFLRTNVINAGRQCHQWNLLQFRRCKCVLLQFQD
jgi:hypothetical protein